VAPRVVPETPSRWRRWGPGVRVRHLIDAEGTSLALYHIDPGTLCDLHEHDFPELGMVLAGNGAITFEEGEQKTEAGDSFYLPGGTRHGFRVPKGGSTVLMLNVEAPSGAGVPDLATLRPRSATGEARRALARSHGGARSAKGLLR
jgi:quercetin dioxygenase-like cupin family protein